ncbi:MAG: UDP-3-O-(3-hydroxymyristoyl)glucosamine N-acyltransferase [Bacteroidales bacterium]|nr:UDP-3-O-(3-hydroxymyristoyl)glucosamine N-acyltransferase [Bacteroidales bacterium]
MKLPQPITVDEMLSIVGGRIKVVGDTHRKIEGINEIHAVQPGDVTYVDHPKYYDSVLKGNATFVFIDKVPDESYGKTLLVCDDPYTPYVALVRHYRRFEPQNACIHPSAQIGEGTVIQPGVFIGPEVRIGKNCIIHANVSIYDHTVIGDEVVIHSNSVIGADAFYFKHRTERWDKLDSCGSVVIGDRVEIGALCTIDKGVSSPTTIGEGCKFDNHIQVGHDTTIGRHCLIGCHTSIAGTTVIEDNCLIWAHSAINKGLVVRKGTTVLATSAVDKSTKEGSVLFGVPAIDAHTKWRELASLRMLPAWMQKIEEKLP